MTLEQLTWAFTIQLIVFMLVLAWQFRYNVALAMRWKQLSDAIKLVADHLDEKKARDKKNAELLMQVRNKMEVVQAAISLMRKRAPNGKTNA
jgi:hypothetical protein